MHCYKYSHLWCGYSRSYHSHWSLSFAQTSQLSHDTSYVVWVHVACGLSKSKETVLCSVLECRQVIRFCKMHEKLPTILELGIVWNFSYKTTQLLIFDYLDTIFT